jgi:putative tricarboxylic transport membrane protein
VFVSGLLGILFRKGKYPPAPLVLGIILGPLVDTNFRRALKASGGDPSIFFTRPVSLILVIVIVLVILGQLGVFDKIRSLFKKDRQPA